MDLVIGLAGLVVLVVGAFWRVLVRAGWVAWRGRRAGDAVPPTMPAWAMTAFSLSPGEVPTTLWRGAFGTELVWVTLTSAGRLAAGTEEGRHLASVDEADLAAGGAFFSEERSGVVEMTIVPARGSSLVLSVDRKAEKALRKWASQVKETP